MEHIIFEGTLPMIMRFRTCMKPWTKLKTLLVNGVRIFSAFSHWPIKIQNHKRYQDNKGEAKGLYLPCYFQAKAMGVNLLVTLMCVQPNWNIHPCSFLKSYQPNLLTIKETRGENQKKVTFSMHNKIAKPSLSFETLFYISNRINKIN